MEYGKGIQSGRKYVSGYISDFNGDCRNLGRGLGMVAGSWQGQQKLIKFINNKKILEK